MKVFPADALEESGQRLRIKRNLMAAATSLLVILLLYSYYATGILPWTIFMTSSSAIVALVIIFYLMFRSGANRKFADPSLTMPQIASAVTVIAYVTHYIEGPAGALLLIYIMAFEFAVFRLNTRQLLRLTAYALTLQLIVGLLRSQHGISSTEVRVEIMQWLVMAVVLVWFAFIGGYINDLRKHLRRLTVTDDLTGLRNRRYIGDLLKAEKNRADRTDQVFCVAFLDIDHFKKLNDTFGHGTGDMVLKEFALTIIQDGRNTDHYARYGGEEFLVLLPQTTLEKAPVFAERIRALTENIVWKSLPLQSKVTVSIGLAEYRKWERWQDTLGRADRALYAAKSGGRNQVRVGT